MHTCTLVLLLLVGVAAAGFAPLHKVNESIKGRYLIKFKDDLDVDTVVDDIQRRVQQQRLGHAKISYRYYRVVKGMAAELSEEALEYIRTLDEVECVSENPRSHATTPWGLDRIDQFNLPLDGSFSTSASYNEGAGVEIWVVDSGIRPTHNDFGNRASVEFDAYGGDGIDCHGHGTHCAGTTGGSYYGVAKRATIKGVKVLGSPPCSKSGTGDAMIAGLDYVAANAKRPALISMSVGFAGTWDYFDTVVRNVISGGIPVIVAAGNDNIDACTVSPSRISEAVTVGATDNTDSRAWYSNWGNCIDIFAPGSDIPSTYYTSDNAVYTMSGTSMACPHVSGMVALYLAENPNLTGAQVMNKLVNSATWGKLSNIGAGSPNLLAYI
ncbi:aqualysin-1-like [Patiria miniata]|uniref:Uncharacterized protein n=1 Tax=Patiria miniata TaxID=46514 RepID=A0A914B9B5_PATMI|nr:aqualysin-1-like [Patiria miniata]